MALGARADATGWVAGCCCCRPGYCAGGRAAGRRGSRWSGAWRGARRELVTSRRPVRSCAAHPGCRRRTPSRRRRLPAGDLWAPAPPVDGRVHDAVHGAAVRGAGTRSTHRARRRCWRWGTWRGTMAGRAAAGGRGRAHGRVGGPAPVRPGHGVLTLLLLVTSPFLLLMAGAFLSHVPALFFAVVALYAATRYAETPSWRWMALLALGLGLTFLTREIVAVFYGSTRGAGGARVGARAARARCLAATCWWMGCCWSARSGLYLGYNAALTGDAVPAAAPAVQPARRLRLRHGDRASTASTRSPRAWSTPRNS